MQKLKVVRKGGLAGFGGASSHLQSSGEIDMDKLSGEDKKAVDDLFKSHSKTGNANAMDTFRYSISRKTAKGTESIEVGEEKIPEAVRQCVKDELI